MASLAMALGFSFWPNAARPVHWSQMLVDYALA